VTIQPDAEVKVRFTLSWFFPHHLTVDGRELGHMYTNWYKDAGEANDFLCAHFDEHYTKTEAFARTLAETSLGDPLAFAWSSQAFHDDCEHMVDARRKLCNLGRVGLLRALHNGCGLPGQFCCRVFVPRVEAGADAAVNPFPEQQGAGAAHVCRRCGTCGRWILARGYESAICNDGVPGLSVDWGTHVSRRDVAHVVKAMAFTASLDTDGDELPDRDTAVQTYDQWRMRGTPAYIASLWLGALRAAVHLADELGKASEARNWKALLEQASANFDRKLFNGEYYSLWVDGALRDELCMTDQVSGEWFTQMIGLPATISPENLSAAIKTSMRTTLIRSLGFTMRQLRSAARACWR